MLKQTVIASDPSCITHTRLLAVATSPPASPFVSADAAAVLSLRRRHPYSIAIRSTASNSGFI